MRARALPWLWLAVGACDRVADPPLDPGADGDAFPIALPEGFPPPSVPTDNPLNEAKAELGRFLFYDVRLSGNGTQSCASCHEQARAFGDARAVSVGSTGEPTPRHSMALVNTAYVSTLTWANPALATLEQQIVVPMFGEFPVELGITGREDEVLARLHADPLYDDLLADAFPGADALDLSHAVDALASFVRTLISGDSPFDRFVYQGDDDALTASALRGMDLFYSERLECHHCHGGFNFSNATAHPGAAASDLPFHNTGLYDVDGLGAYPPGNNGLFEVTGLDADRGRFRAPTLRNVAVSAPYMHDGSVATLDEVISLYEAGGRNVTEGPYAGDGRDNPNKSAFVSGFTLTAQERADLLAFLESLTDPGFLTREALSDPFAP